MACITNGESARRAPFEELPPSSSAETAAKPWALALLFFFTGRAHDIFVGVDVFGRGCPGGGGFDSDKALTMINYHGLSSAIFAPAWTHEKAEHPEDFQDRDRLFWSKLEPLLHHRGLEFKGGSVDLVVQSGCGEKDGSWWLNLSEQSQLPCFENSSVYELFCDMKLENTSRIRLEVCASFEGQVSDDVQVMLVFDEEDQKVMEKVGVDGTKLTFNCDLDQHQSKCLHFVQVQNKGVGGQLKKLAIIVHNEEIN